MMPWYMLSIPDKGRINEYYQHVQIVWSSCRRSTTDILPLLHHSRARAATDSRDKIFRLLASQLWTPYHSFMFVITALLPVSVNYVMVHIRQHRNLFILYQAGLETAVEGVPLWVPDWSIPAPSPDLGYSISHMY